MSISIPTSGWEQDFEPTLRTFCHQAALDWEEVLRFNRGESSRAYIEPFLGIGPKIPTWALPLLMHKRFIYALLGPNPNMVTIVLNRARNRMVFFGAERTENGKYLEMIRLDEALPVAFQEGVCRMLQAGDDKAAYEAIHRCLDDHNLSQFKPGMLKIADLYFFEAFLELSGYQPSKAPLGFALQASRVARRVLSNRLLHFYPKIPFERVLGVLRTVTPPLALQPRSN